MKQLFIIVLISFAFCLSSCQSNDISINNSSTPTSSVTEQSSESLTALRVSDNVLENKLLEKTTKTEQLYQFQCADFDHNGKVEAFGIIGHKEGIENIPGTLWFANDLGAQKVSTFVGERECDEFRDQSEIIEEKNCSLVSYAADYATGSPSILLQVKEGKPVQIPLFGDGLTKTENEYLIYQNRIDASSLGGRTLKPYWLYWDEKSNSFREYGAIKITAKQFEQLDGATKVLKQIQSEGGKIVDILYRENAIININYQLNIQYEDNKLIADNRYYTVKVQGNSVSIIEEEYRDGIYDVASNPNIATMPKKFIK
ncbi:hypothetical protein RBG61_05255 [Paludicola sp. MB14-C6]|uniref:hypothetical protein n=1 Tax=Paludihabitans sp. MB14-C6 TaxID=3070656 RepID=UPI0027DB869C|nr:hypothetical protein [Paludicola sp. MB14-C6]WMJ24078.1 hypothetical protein RBG61_05255 [Paludicola sp. MB14-C6]